MMHKNLFILNPITDFYQVEEIDVKSWFHLPSFLFFLKIYNSKIKTMQTRTHYKQVMLLQNLWENVLLIFDQIYFPDWYGSSLKPFVFPRQRREDRDKSTPNFSAAARVWKNDAGYRLHCGVTFFYEEM